MTCATIGGALPSSLGLLFGGRCSYLDLSGNQVNGSIPDSIGDLAALS
jgi:hypothetical protein